MSDSHVPQPPRGRPPVVVCFRPGIAAVLRTAGLGCDVVAYERRADPPARHRADVCLGGHLLGDGARPWAAGASWVHLTGVGVDNVPAWLIAGRTVTNSPGSNSAAVAEFALAALLAAAKDLPAT